MQVAHLSSVGHEEEGGGEEEEDIKVIIMLETRQKCTGRWGL